MATQGFPPSQPGASESMQGLLPSQPRADGFLFLILFVIYLKHTLDRELQARHSTDTVSGQKRLVLVNSQQ